MHRTVPGSDLQYEPVSFDAHGRERDEVEGLASDRLVAQLGAASTPGGDEALDDTAGSRLLSQPGEALLDAAPDATAMQYASVIRDTPRGTAAWQAVLAGT